MLIRDHLRASTATQQSLEQARQASAQAEQEARERLTPLEVRLARVLATIPDTVQQEGISLPVIQKMLKGRWRGTPHPGEVGTALRALGWRRERRWRGDQEGFRALWLPPAAR
jgi:hypothetical protein